MAITRTETQVTWSASNSVTVGAAGTQTSDAIALDQTCFAAQISMKADNAGTPVAADQIYVWLEQTSGDPDGTGSDEYDSSHSSTGRLLGVLQTGSVDPAIMTVALPLPQKSLRIRAEGATTTTTQNITVSATITEQRSG